MSIKITPTIPTNKSQKEITAGETKSLDSFVWHGRLFVNVDGCFYDMQKQTDDNPPADESIVKLVDIEIKWSYKKGK